MEFWDSPELLGAASAYTITDADALTWANNVASSDGVQLPDAIKQALDTYVQALKPTGLGGAAGSIWSQAAQLLLPCGPRTLAGALRPLKGAAPTNGSGLAGATQFTSDDYNRETGLGNSANAGKYLSSNVSVNTIPATSNGIFAYGSIAATGGEKSIAGWFNGSNETGLIILDQWSAYAGGRVYRVGTYGGPTLSPVSASTAAANCVIGSKTASNSTTLYVDGTTITSNANIAPLLNSLQPIYYYANNINNAAGGFASCILQAAGIFSTGLNAAQAAALRTATATYVAAVAAAIP